VQVYAQPVFATIEDNLLSFFPALNKLGSNEWVLRLVYRYVPLSLNYKLLQMQEGVFGLDS
jgi:hypothetical protein